MVRLLARIGCMADAFRQDLGYAIHAMRRSPGLTATIVVTLGLGVGANASVFSLLDRVYFQSPPGVKQPRSVRRVYASLIGHSGSAAGGAYLTPYVSVPDLRDLGAAARGAAAIEGYMGLDVRPLGSTGDSAAIAWVSGGFFGMLGVHSARGRFFDPEESRFGDPRPVAVLSHGFWRRHFASDPAILGRTIPVDSTTYTIIGVAQRKFEGVDLDAADVWIPLAARPGGAEGGANWYQALGSGAVRLVARLEGRTDSRALDQLLTAQYRRTNADASWFDARGSIVTAPLLEARGPLGLGPQDERNLTLAIRLAGVALAVLVIAAANVASLLLMRALRRRQEIAVRLALGVSRRRLFAQAAVETVLLGILACGAAVLLTLWTGAVLRTMLLSDIRWTTTVLNHRVVLAAMILAGVTALTAGLAPTALVLRGDIAIALRGGAPEPGSPGSNLRIGLLVTQAALCMALLAGAGVFLQSLGHATHVDLGFDANRLISVSVSGRPTSDAEFDDAMERVRAVAGVQAAAAAGRDLRPWGSGPMVWTADGDTLRGGRAPSYNFVDPDYFGVAGLRLIAGRILTMADGAGTEPVAVITESFAAALWPRGAVGQCFYGSWPATCRRVIGVIKTLRWNVTEVAQPHFFAPRAQGPRGLTHNLLVRTSAGATPSDAARVYGAVRSTLGGSGGQLLVRRLADRLEPMTRPWRVAATLFFVFGMLALGCAAAGIYGLVSYDVTSRARELAVRTVLGATPERILRHVVGGGLRVMLAGLLIGAAAALLAGPFIAALLFETSPFDPLAIAAAGVTLAVAAVVASTAAARRATRLDLVVVLNAQ